MALGLAQPLTEMSARSISWGNCDGCVRLTTLPPSCTVVMKPGNLNLLEPSGHLGNVMGLIYHFTVGILCCAINRKVACSIPDDVIGIFHYHNPSDLTMELGSTQPLTEMNTKSISWGKKRPVRKAVNLTIILGHCHVIWEP